LRSAITACTATAHSTASTTEGNSSVTRGLDDAAPIFGHESIGDHAVFAERAGCADLISAHKPGITGDISRQHCRQTSLYALARHESPSGKNA
jgi:hypothetical protein